MLGMIIIMVLVPRRGRREAIAGPTVLTAILDQELLLLLLLLLQLLLQQLSRLDA
jgi:hypothetical protein